MHLLQCTYYIAFTVWPVTTGKFINNLSFKKRQIHKNFKSISLENLMNFLSLKARTIFFTYKWGRIWPGLQWWHYNFYVLFNTFGLLSITKILTKLWNFLYFDMRVIFSSWFYQLNSNLKWLDFATFSRFWHQVEFHYKVIVLC